MEKTEDVFDFDGLENTVNDNSTEDIFDTSFEDNEDQHEGDDLISEPDEEDYITTVLKSKGIDRNKIQVYDENNELTEMNFDDLSASQKVDLLTDNPAPDNGILSEGEIETLNYLRSNNMSLEDFANWQKKQAIDEYLAQQTPNSVIDTYSDDEIIAYDLIKRFGDDISDEEVDAEIDRLKGDSDAYVKRVALLRNSYKSEAEAQAKLYEDQRIQQQEAFNSSFINAYKNAVADLNDIQGISLEDEDKSELLDFVLNKDAADQTAFSKALDNPSNVLKMAWFILHGDEAFEKTVDYFKSEIAKREKSTPRAVTRTNTTNRKSAFSI